MVTEYGDVLARSIISSSAIGDHYADLLNKFAPVAVILGDGTAAKAIEDSLVLIAPAASITRVDERYTSEAARSLFLDDHPARGLNRLMPRSLRTPDAPYDDYVAVILGRRWWNGERKPQSE